MDHHQTRTKPSLSTEQAVAWLSLLGIDLSHQARRPRSFWNGVSEHFFELAEAGIVIPESVSTDGITFHWRQDLGYHSRGVYTMKGERFTPEQRNQIRTIIYHSPGRKM